MDTNNRPPHRPAGLPPSMRPHRPAPNPPAHRPAGQHAPAPAPQSKSRRLGFWMLITALLVIVVGIGWLIFRIATGNYNELAIKKDRYQAVFLNNSMVYFGKLSDVDGSYVKLTDVYYLQFQNQGQNQSGNQNSQSQQVSLAKLGTELHSPEDAMYIDRKSIMFWENLQNDGRVIQAIKDYQSKNGIK